MYLLSDLSQKQVARRNSCSEQVGGAGVLSSWWNASLLAHPISIYLFALDSGCLLLSLPLFVLLLIFKTLIGKWDNAILALDSSFCLDSYQEALSLWKIVLKFPRPGGGSNYLVAVNGKKQTETNQYFKEAHQKSSRVMGRDCLTGCSSGKCPAAVPVMLQLGESLLAPCTFISHLVSSGYGM